MKIKLTESQLRQYIQENIKQILKEDFNNNGSAFERLQAICDKYCDDVRYEYERENDGEINNNLETFSYDEWYILLTQVKELLYMIKCRDFFEENGFSRFIEVRNGLYNGSLNSNDERVREYEDLDINSMGYDEMLFDDYLENYKSWMEMPTREEVLKMVGSLKISLEVDVEESMKLIHQWEESIGTYIDSLLRS